MTTSPERAELNLSLLPSSILRVAMLRLSSVAIVPYGVYSLEFPVPFVCKYLPVQKHLFQLPRMDTTEAVAPAATPADIIEPTDLHVGVTSQEFSSGTKLVVCSHWPTMACHGV